MFSYKAQVDDHMEDDTVSLPHQQSFSSLKTDSDYIYQVICCDVCINETVRLLLILKYIYSNRLKKLFLRHRITACITAPSLTQIHQLTLYMLHPCRALIPLLATALTAVRAWKLAPLLLDISVLICKV